MNILLLFFVTILIFIPFASAVAGKPSCSGAGGLSTPKAQTSMCNCGWYKDNACCESTGFVGGCDNNGFPHRDGGCTKFSPLCDAYENMAWCFYNCAPNYNKFVGVAGGEKEAVGKLRVCPNFVDNWYEACAGDQYNISNTCQKLSDALDTPEKFVETTELTLHQSSVQQMYYDQSGLPHQTCWNGAISLCLSSILVMLMLVYL